MDIKIDFDAFISSLRYMGFGLLGIFAITFIIIGLVQLLIKVFPTKKND